MSTLTHYYLRDGSQQDHSRLQLKYLRIDPSRLYWLVKLLLFILALVYWTLECYGSHALLYNVDELCKFVKTKSI